MTIVKIKNYIKENFQILLAALFFICWKFYLISIFLKNTLNDDSLVYVHHIKTIASCPTIIFCKEFLLSFEGYGGFEHLTYRLFFGTLSHILNLDSLNIFYLSFYIGTLFAVPAIIFFLSNINSDKKIVAFSLFFLAFFNGAGSYHGFFWVVPSFFALLLFFIVFSIIIGNCKKWTLYLFLLVPLLIYTHFIGLYMLSIPVFFFILKSISTKKIDPLLMKKIIFLIVVTIIFYVPTAIHLKDSIYGGNPYGVESLMRDSGKNALPVNIMSANIISDSTTNQKLNSDSFLEKTFPGFKQIYTDYFDWMFPHPLALMLFLLIIFILFYYKQHTILLIYFSALIFTIISTINIFAVRSLIFLWPITYVFYAYGIWFSLKFINDSVKNKKINILLRTIMVLAILIFVGMNITYSFLSAKEIPISFKKLLK